MVVLVISSEGQMDGDGQADRCGCSSETGAVPVRLDEEELRRRRSSQFTGRSAFLTEGHDLWEVTGRTRSRIQVAKMSFLRRAQP